MPRRLLWTLKPADSGGGTLFAWNRCSDLLAVVGVQVCEVVAADISMVYRCENAYVVYDAEIAAGVRQTWECAVRPAIPLGGFPPAAGAGLCRQGAGLGR